MITMPTLDWDVRARNDTPNDPPAAPSPALAVVDDIATGAGGLMQAAVAVLAIVATALTVQVTAISGFQHQSAQSRAFAKLRGLLAEGTAPVAAMDRQKHLLPLGSPVALIEIPSIGVREVIGEGTTPGVLTNGPGHRRDTPMPGQAGISEIYGRRSAYGGPFKRLSKLRVGNQIKVTTGQGVSHFKVIGFRRAGDRIPDREVGTGRLSLATATGRAFIPSSVLWVDAELTDAARPTPPRAIAAGAVPDAEKPMGTDASTLWALVLWLQALIGIAVGAVWSWMRWGRHQTWIVFGPVAAVAGLAAAGQVARLLPNLL